MIVETVVDLFYSILQMAFGGFEMIGLPFDLINVLSSITVYGIWVVGADVMALFVGTVVFWWTVKFSAGLVVWIWERLPLT